MDFGKQLEKQKAKFKKQIEKDVMKAIKNGTFSFAYYDLPGEEVVNNYVEAIKEIDQELQKNGYRLDYGYTDSDINVEIAKI